MTTTNFSKLDSNFEVADGLVWYDVRGLVIEGKGWTDTESPFDRLPARAQSMVRPPVWALREVFKVLRDAGHNKLWLVPGDTLLGDDGDATVDGTHPTDVGFMRMAAALEPVLREALRDPNTQTPNP